MLRIQRRLITTPAQANSKDELITDRRIYPWDGNTVRYQKRNKYQGKMLANFKRSGGDYGGMAGALNDRAFTPAPVRSNWPNDFGLYNMPVTSTNGLPTCTVR